jgi:hypothetical protein
MRDVMLKMMLLELERAEIDIEGACDKATNIAHLLFTAAQLDEVQNLGGIGQRVLNFPGKVGIAVLPHSHMIDVRDLRTGGIQTCFHRERWESSVVLDTVESLFRNREKDLAILHDRSGGIRVEHV